MNAELWVAVGMAATALLLVAMVEVCTRWVEHHRDEDNPRPPGGGGAGVGSGRRHPPAPAGPVL